MHWYIVGLSKQQNSVSSHDSGIYLSVVMCCFFFFFYPRNFITTTCRIISVEILEDLKIVLEDTLAEIPKGGYRSRVSDLITKQCNRCSYRGLLVTAARVWTKWLTPRLSAQCGIWLSVPGSFGGIRRFEGAAAVTTTEETNLTVGLGSGPHD